jgi:peptide/nickel transport system substrate-binding protein
MVARDGVTWTLELRKGVKFHDGTPFNADAVKVNFERWQDPNIRSSTLKNVVGPSIKSVESVDEYTVRLTTNGPRPGLPDMLSGWAVQIVSPTALKQHGPEIAIKQSGTGPFKIESFVPGETLSLVRNDDYWGGAPSLERLVFRSIAEPSARTAALLTGAVDLSINLPPSQAARLKSEAQIRVLEQPAVLQYWVEMNENNPPLNNPLVRKAINYAINMEELKSVAYEGYLRPFQGPVPPELFQSDPSIKGYEFNPDRARELLQQAGVSNPRLRFVFEDDPVNVRYAEVLQGQLKRVGIELDLARTETAATEEAYVGGKYDLIIAGFSNSSGDPWALFRAQLQSAARNNAGGHKDPRFDPLIEQLGTTLDPEKRTQILNEFFRVYFDAAPYAATANPIVIYATNNRVDGFTPYPSLDLLSLRSVTAKQ